MRIASLCLVTVVACTKPNPEVCCTTADECSSLGITDERPCEAGHVCKNHECVIASCSTEGCTATLPVCNLGADVCDGCTETLECARFPEQQLCNVLTGACVQCVTGSDCDALKPICDVGECRGCELDSDCTSGACDDTGACVPQSEVVYIDAAGTNLGTCTPTSPCRTIDFAVTQTTASRSHIVMAIGAYTQTASIDPPDTLAARLWLHGSGASFAAPPANDGSAFVARVPMTIRDLTLISAGGTAFFGDSGGEIRLERVTIDGGTRGASLGPLTLLKDVTFKPAGIALLLGITSRLTANRVVFEGGSGQAIAGTGVDVVVDISNTLVYGTTDLAIDLPYAAGSLSFVTIADSGTDSGAGPRAVVCSANLTIRSSIIWAPGTTTRAPVQGCSLSSTIAGPTTVPGVTNANPMFVNALNGDYRLAPGSPARDVVDIGPAMDFEGDPRPQGMRYDVGADESP